MKREYLDLDDQEIPDGGSVRTPLFLVDAVRFKDGEPHFVRASDGVDLSDHQPGFRLADARLRDAARRERSRWIGRMVDAWKMGPPLGSEGQNKTDPRQLNRSALSHEPDNSSSLAEWREHSDPDDVMRRHLMRGGPDDEPDDGEHDVGAVMRRHQRQRDDAWTRYRDDLGNKWRTGRTDPNAATRIEQGREKYLGKFER